MLTHCRYPHLYQTEIESYEYPETMYEQSEPRQYPPFESTTATFVDTPEALETMLEELKTAREIAVDLEHHDNRSYIGIVSLMQISTRDKDWIVDTLKPWRRKLACLNEVFADPSIIKVLHGAHMDIIWLQRDLGLYVVGLFDTYHAARSLGYPGASLAYLLDRFVQFKAQKQYQIADWRVRPLSKELFEYARADTHFLLYVFDNMRNELVQRSDFSNPEKNKVQDVLQKSKETALQRYEHPVYDSDLGLGVSGWHRLILRTPVQFTPQQFSVFRAVHRWRDDLARKEDESPLFIMPNHALFSIARAIPSDKAALFTTVQHVSHLARAHADELVDIIATAKKEQGPELQDVLNTVAEMRALERAEAEAVPIQPLPAQPVSLAQVEPLQSDLAVHVDRAAASEFWGKLWQDDPKEPKKSDSVMEIDLALPLPPLTAEIFAPTNGGPDATPKEKPQHTFVPKQDRVAEDERTDIFVVKQLGGKKRKRFSDDQPTPTLDPMTNDEISLDQPADSEDAMRAEEKAARKAAKMEKKKKKHAEAAALDRNEPVFDYANAPSVLHAQDGDGKKKKGDKKDKKKKGGFNAFTGLANAPKGLPRQQKEIAGRSRTFTS